MLTLIRNVEVFAPEPMGRQDLLLANGQIEAMAPQIRLTGSVPLETVEGNGLIACPGFIDSLVHITGGGGEGGFHTRTPAMALTEATLAGVSTVVGALGTDAISRTLPDLIAKCYALRQLGLGCFFYTGGYQVPVRTLLADVSEDVMLLEPCLGVGEVAIADHRSSHPSPQELIRLASQARTGGLLSGKAGVVSIHLGDDPTGLEWLRQSVAQSNLPLSQFYPTHVNRTEAVFQSAIEFGLADGWLDITASTTPELLAQGEVAAAEALRRLLSAGVSPSRVTLSSDGNASLPSFDADGRYQGLQVGRVASLHQAVVAAHELGVPLEQVLACVSRNPATVLGLADRGRLAPGLRADLLLLERDSLAVQALWCGGKAMVQQGRALVTEPF
ncbi:beta-aspartyl-peptidase [Ferrimonas marina]|uniref:Isoaspartyl dipeptidase n=1 Tax=Ferrimonas marina TaxID=299255 RepID=A0A1M5NXE8_9GAMM|nr:beta-aspartyl-peptidase [Ferrimonas marina]SHG93839.1 beta-aspartyl-dipeptidase (metallo-type) [Ferrimonas marina]